ncbi:MAG TPA: 2-phospho-L-lactate guanylyltransferase [bacterium]|nr:2-phospho-L-lactate guanylyltransferase [bacterium]
MKARVIVPQKPLALAKGRLAAVLDPRTRATLSLTLLRGVCVTLRAAADVEGLVVMTLDPDIRARVAAWGVRTITDPAPGLNHALAEALVSFSTRSHGLLVLAGDLPFLRPADIAALLSARTPRGIGLAPSKDGAGTNALLLPPGILLRPAFGRGSLVAHRRQALALGLTVTEIARPGLAFDLDTPADFAAYLVAEGSTRGG